MRREVIAFMLIHKRDSRAMASGATCGDAPRKMLTKIISEENEDEEALRIVVVVVVGVVVLLGGGSCAINPTIGDRRDRFASCFSHTHSCLNFRCRLCHFLFLANFGSA